MWGRRLEWWLVRSLCRSVNPTLPLDVTALPTENPFPLFRFVMTTKNMGRYVVFLCWLQCHPRGFQVFLQLRRQDPDLCYKGPSLLLFWIKWSLAHRWKTWRLGKNARQSLVGHLGRSVRIPRQTR